MLQLNVKCNTVVYAADKCNSVVHAPAKYAAAELASCNTYSTEAVVHNNPVISVLHHIICTVVSVSANCNTVAPVGAAGCEEPRTGGGTPPPETVCQELQQLQQLLNLPGSGKNTRTTLTTRYVCNFTAQFGSIRRQVQCRCI